MSARQETKLKDIKTIVCCIDFPVRIKFDIQRGHLAPPSWNFQPMRLVLHALAGELNAWVAQNEIDKVASGALWI